MSSTTTTQVSLLVLLLAVCLCTRCGADPYAAPPPPGSAVSGKTFPPPPETIFCMMGTKCGGSTGKSVTCPDQCPDVKPSDPNTKGCLVDCSAKCEAVCKKRKPNCDGMGAACFDPRFVGGDGIMFYFHGKKNEHFSLVSDYNLQVNARFIGLRPTGRSRDNTWIQALGLLFHSNSFTLEANKVAQWDDQVDQLLFTYNGMPLAIPPGHHSVWTAPGPDKLLVVERTAKFNSVTVILPGIVEMSVNVVPVTKEDDRIHKYQIPSDDCFAHLEVQFKFLHLSEKVEGVLGQTYRPGFKNPVKRGVPMPVMGGEDKFKTSSLVSADCKRCVFATDASSSASANPLELDPSMTVDCTSKMSNGPGIACRR